MSSDGDNPPSPTKRDIFNLIGELKQSIDNSKIEITQTFRSELSNAIIPIKNKQNEMSVDLEKTKQSVSDIITNYEQTRTQLQELQLEVSTIKQNFTLQPVPTNSSIQAPPSTPQVSVQEESGKPATDAIQVLKSAKKILGFSPITPVIIINLGEQLNIENESSLKAAAVCSFMNSEMKIPRSITESLVIVRTFTPAKQPQGWSTLYAEFEDMKKSFKDHWHCWS